MFPLLSMSSSGCKMMLKLKFELFQKECLISRLNLLPLSHSLTLPPPTRSSSFSALSLFLLLFVLILLVLRLGLM